MKWEEALRFWFEESAPKQWFTKDEAFDAQLRERFADAYEAVVRGEWEQYRSDPKARLAEILVLDQFARNMFRGSAKAFAADTIALRLAEEAVALGMDTGLTPQERHFLYMPFMHSESAAAHEKAMRLFEVLGNQEALNYEIEHKAIIDRFGRYPHRNAILGRASTPEEIEFVRHHKGF